MVDYHAWHFINGHYVQLWDHQLLVQLLIANIQLHWAISNNELNWRCVWDKTAKISIYCDHHDMHGSYIFVCFVGTAKVFGE